MIKEKCERVNGRGSEKVKEDIRRGKEDDGRVEVEEKLGDRKMRERGGHVDMNSSF